MFRQDGSCPALLEDLSAGFPYGAVTRSGPPFQAVLVTLVMATGLVPVRSPLLGESRLMSFPPATEMFQFAGFASRAYGFSTGYPLRGGLPHSEIPGSPIARISPGLFAACHVLHRLSVPRHPPNALKTLVRKKPSHAGESAVSEQSSDTDSDPRSRACAALLLTAARLRALTLRNDFRFDAILIVRLCAMRPRQAAPRAPGPAAV